MQRKRIAIRSLFLAAVAGVLSVTSSARAGLTAYYTLDNLGTGVQNQGTDGATSDLVSGGGTITAVAGQVGSGGLSFNGTATSFLAATGAGNAADDLTGYPFTFSLWVRDFTGAARGAAMSVSNRAPTDQYYNVGVGVDAGNVNQAEMIVRNPGFNDTNAAGSNAADGGWHNVVAVFDTGGVQRIFYDGKLAGTGADTEAFTTAANTFAIGGFLRGGSTTAATDPFKGSIDDAGLFDNGLNASDAALVNGLGKTGGIGLDQLDEAQSLLATAVGTSGTIGGVLWQRASGLAGTTGDFGGTVAGGDAFVVTDASGNGLQQSAAVPEPSTAAVLLLGGAWLGRRRVASPVRTPLTIS